MEDNPRPSSSSDPSPSSSSGGNGSSSRSPSLAQRFSRQISRGILPALRNLVRSNRSQQRSRVAPEHPHTELAPMTTSTTIQQPPPENPLPDSQQPSNPPITCTTTSTQPSVSDIPINFVPPPPPLPELPPPLIDDDEPPQLEQLPLNPLAALSNLINNEAPPSEDADAPSTTTNSRQRYRLVVYFEERSQEEQPTARYVAVIVGRLDELQFLVSFMCTLIPFSIFCFSTTNYSREYVVTCFWQVKLSSSNNERGFGDILNHLFNAYTPKGTPPATKDSIDSLPTVTIADEEQSCMVSFIITREVCFS